MTDNCPNCCNGPCEPLATRTDQEQHTDRYRCTRCGHTWITRRNPAVYAHPAARAVPPAA